MTVRKPLEEAEAASTTASEHITPSAEAGPSNVNTSSSSRNGTIHKQALDTDDEHWQRFAMLEEAPADHHFIGELSNQAGAKTYHTRLAKEHRALASSLPGELDNSHGREHSGKNLNLTTENILVRTYENRTDLLRVLILGPEGTP